MKDLKQRIENFCTDIDTNPGTLQMKLDYWDLVVAGNHVYALVEELELDTKLHGIFLTEHEAECAVDELKTRTETSGANPAPSLLHIKQIQLNVLQVD